MMKPSNVVRRTRPKAAPLPGSSGSGGGGTSRRQQASPGRKREAAIHGKVDAGLAEPSKPPVRAIGGARRSIRAMLCWTCPCVLCHATLSLLPSIMLGYAVPFLVLCCAMLRSVLSVMLYYAAPLCCDLLGGGVKARAASGRGGALRNDGSAVVAPSSPGGKGKGAARRGP
eukprot:COSAG02_NODE_22800_length_740_cov_0.555382_1_plen_170_part_01